MPAILGLENKLLPRMWESIIRMYKKTKLICNGKTNNRGIIFTKVGRIKAIVSTIKQQITLIQNEQTSFSQHIE